jgi:hypothetical protein
MEKHKFELMQSDKDKKIYLCDICDCQKTFFSHLRLTCYMRNSIFIGNEEPKCVNMIEENLKTID